jgi:hypothetical protein
MLSRRRPFVCREIWLRNKLTRYLADDIEFDHMLLPIPFPSWADRFLPVALKPAVEWRGAKNRDCRTVSLVRVRTDLCRVRPKCHAIEFLWSGAGDTGGKAKWYYFPWSRSKR